MSSREPIELEVGRVAMSACKLLAREMDELEQDLSHRAGTDRCSIYREPACNARRVVMLCSRLRTAMQRYAASQARLREQIDAMKFEDEEESVLDF